MRTILHNPLRFLACSAFCFGVLLASLPADTLCAPKSGAEAVGNPRSLALNEQGLAALKDNKPQEAEELLSQAVKVDPGNLTALYNLAGVLVFNKKKEEAIVLLEKHRVQSLNDAGLLVRYGDLLFSTGKTKEAVTQYEKAYALNKSYAGLTAKLGLTYALQSRLDESEQMYLAAAKAEPRNGDILGNLSSILLSLGKTEQAISTAKEAVQFAPKKETFVTLGSAYEAKKEFAAALDSFTRARDLGAKTAEVDEKIAALTKLAKPVQR